MADKKEGAAVKFYFDTGSEKAVYYHTNLTYLYLKHPKSCKL